MPVGVDRRESWAPPGGGSASAPHRACTAYTIPGRLSLPGRIAFASVRRLPHRRHLFGGRVEKVPPPIAGRLCTRPTEWPAHGKMIVLRHVPNDVITPLSTSDPDQLGFQDGSPRKVRSPIVRGSPVGTTGSC